MEHFNKNFVLCVIWLLILILAAAAIWILSSRQQPAEPDVPAIVPPSADVVATQALTQGNELITNTTAHYEAIVPATWYLEKKSGSGITLYPDYDPADDIPPTCKIEISLLQNQQSDDLDDWLTDYLHADPTADVVEASRVSSTVSGHPTITWTGTLNGVSTTLAYISREDGSVYEIAPSVVEKAGDDAAPDDDASVTCLAAFQSLVSSFRIMP